MLMDSADKPSAFVHFVGATTEDAVLMRDRDISVVWSPRSNIALYGHTANVTLLDRLGVNIALSSDWLPSGSMNLLRELSCAASYSDTYLDGYFSSYDLWKMVTINALARMAMGIAGKEIEIRHIEGPLGVRGRNSDNRYIEEKLGWRPSLPLYDGMERTYTWIRDQVEAARES